MRLTWLRPAWTEQSRFLRSSNTLVKSMYIILMKKKANSSMMFTFDLHDMCTLFSRKWLNLYIYCSISLGNVPYRFTLCGPILWSCGGASTTSGVCRFCTQYSLLYKDPSHRDSWYLKVLVFLTMACALKSQTPFLSFHCHAQQTAALQLHVSIWESLCGYSGV